LLTVLVAAEQKNSQMLEVEEVAQTSCLVVEVVH
jgi:hypothetical protein